MGSSFLFFDILIIGCGFYLMYVAYNMKKTGEINNTVIVGKNCDVSKAKDKQGFIDYMYMKSIIMGAIIAIGGAFDFVNEKLGNSVYFSLLNQYTPYYLAKEHPILKNKVTKLEYKRVVKHLINLGFDNAFIQEDSSSDECFIPDFNSEFDLEKFLNGEDL